ncbi:MAG: hypothetical protein IPL46_19200 [Saprospiraceae bacterium]|nr:hypothetical protein [Saprospiraceae bacterium]
MMKFILLSLVFCCLLNMPLAQTTVGLDKALAYITGQQGAFENFALSEDDIYLSSSHVSSISGVSHIYLQQKKDGIDILNAVGSVHLDSNQQIAYASSAFLDITQYVFHSGKSISQLDAYKPFSRLSGFAGIWSNDISRGSGREQS